MPEQGTVTRKKLVVFYVLDTSGSMEDDGKIGALNEAMRETVDVLQNIAKGNADAEIQIAVLQFSSGAQWVTEKPKYVEDFYWDDLKAGGLTDIGDALSELYNKMSRHEFLQSNTGYMIPIIIFMSDGYPTDNWEKALQKITDKETGNKWFRYSTKIAFALGKDADVNTLSKIVGNKEAVIQTSDLETFKKMIKVVSANTVLTNSISHPQGQGTSGTDIVKKITDEEKDPQPVPNPPEPDPVPPEPIPGPAPEPIPGPGSPITPGW